MSTLENLLSKAHELHRLGDATRPDCDEYDQALEVLASVLRASPKEKKAYNLRWHIRFLQGDPKGALADLNEAINIAPESAEALYNRGYLHEHLKQYREAEADFRAALEIAKRRNDENLIYAIEHHIDVDFEN